MRSLPLSLALIALLVASGARGHETSSSYLTIDASHHDDGLRAVWDIAILDLHWALDLDRDDDSRVTWGEIEANRNAIAAFATEHLRIDRAGESCDVTSNDVALSTRAGEPHASLAFRVACAEAGALAIGSSLFFAEDAAQRVLLDVVTSSGRFAAVLSLAESTWRQPRVPSWRATLGNFLVQGVWHIWIGYDHMAFLLLLLLPSVLRATQSGWQSTNATGEVTRDLITVVSAFTVAHSVSLGLAASGTVQIPVKPIEIAIAGSILVAGLLNLIPRARRWRVALAFGFGLVHGFGFANALAELGASGTRIVPMLAGFNLGVELGQLAIVLIVLPLLLWLRRTPFYAARLMPAASLAIAMAGAFWLLQRVA